MLIKNTKYEILTPIGFSDFDGININIDDYIEFTFDDNTSIKTSHKHRFISNNIELYANTLSVGSYVSNKKIHNIKVGKDILLYDPINVRKGNSYIGNDLIHHNCDFLGSSLTLIPGDALSKMSPMVSVVSKDSLDVFISPIKGRTYVMTVDVAKGTGGDFSTINVIDITELPYKQVAKYKNNKIAPLLFPNIIYKIAKEYNDAYVLIEINISEQVAHILHYELEYENMLLINKTQKGLNRGQIVGGGFGNKPQLGVNTDKKVKRVGCANLKSLIVENKLLINDSDTIAELSTFIEVRDSFEADDGYHDDLVMGLVIFSWLTGQQFFKELNNVNLRRIMYANQMMAIEEEMTPFGFYDDGNEAEENQPLFNF